MKTWTRLAARLALAAGTSLAVLTGLLAGVPAAHAVTLAAPGASAGGSATPPPDRLADPAAVLAPGWQHSPDRAVAVAGDATGLHVLTADASTGYTWRTAATLTVTGTDTSEWIGQACVTGNGRYAVVVYAPRQITNDVAAFGFGALAAVVNLVTGQVTRLGAGVSIAYFDPGCGTGQTAVLTQGGTGADPVPGPEVTHLMLLNVPAGKITADVAVPGQVTSAVPYRGQIAAVHGPGVVSIGSRGQLHTLAQVTGRAFRLVPDAAGGLGFQVATSHQAQVRRYAAGHDRLIGTAPLGGVELMPAGGRVVVTGRHAAALGRLPAAWRAMDVPAGATLSTTGALALTSVSTPLNARGRSPLAAVPDAPQPVRISAVTAAGRRADFTVPAAPRPAAAGQPRPLPGFPRPGRTSRAASQAASRAADSAQSNSPEVNPPPSNVNPATTTYDPDRTCSVPRNDPSIQTYQPSAQQIEWAVDEAVRNDLTGTRGADLYGSGLPAYTPQGMFAAPGLDGGGSVPAQVMLGILAQESNLDQASDHAIIGQTGNFMPAYDWYGLDSSLPNSAVGSYVEWGTADCGYGIAQITSGMCLAGVTGCTSPYPYNDQLAIAIDYQANIAAGLQILEQKWNQLHSLGIIPGNASSGNPKYIENWYFALWDYNAGLEPNAANGNTTGCSPSPSCTDSSGNWGLGWANNPANMQYPPDRPQFLVPGTAGGTTYTVSYDLSHPQDWNYPEKVIGFAFNSIDEWNYVAGADQQAYAYGTWPASATQTADPTPTVFCSQASATNDNCAAGDVNVNNATTTTDPCQLSNDHCWWHWPATWTNCATTCGTQVLTYAAGAAAPGDPGEPSGYAPDCSSSPLPASAVIVGDVPSSIPAPLGCGESWSNNGGTMTWKFAAGVDPVTGSVNYPSKIDFHQIGGGYSGHFWFTHTIASNQSSVTSTTANSGDADFAVTGTWTPPTSVTGWTRIMAAIPNSGAWDPEAIYQINLGGGAGTVHRVINQAQQSDTWVDLGVYDLGSGAGVSLNNVTYEGLGYDIAWDAMAFVPAQKPTADYVALGDSYSAGKGLTPYQPNSSYNVGLSPTTPAMTSNCDRSAAQAYPDLVAEPGSTTPIAQQASTLGSGSEFAFLACSGQWTTQITEAAADESAAPAYGQVNQAPMQNVPAWDGVSTGYGELPQADQGALNSNTTLVTLSSGGDDVRFAAILEGCVESEIGLLTGGTDCATGATLAGDPEPLDVYEPTVISNLTPHLERAYQAIAAAAPNADIVVLSYPNLFAGDTSALGCPAAGIGPDVASWMNEMGDDLRGVIAQAVSYEQSRGLNIHLINPEPAFAGHHACDTNNWINAIAGQASFHPTAAGQQEFATLVDECLAGDLPAADGDGSC